MALELKQGVKLSQQLKLTRQLQQAIKLLQLSRVELEEHIGEHLVENPVLEERAEDEGAVVERTEEQEISDHIGKASEIVDRVGQENTSEVDWESLARTKEAAQTTKVAQTGDGAVNYENIVTKAKSLTDCLLDQIAEGEFTEREAGIAQLIIGDVDGRGYLTTTMDDIAHRGQATVQDVEAVLSKVQEFEPSGVGARDLAECLMIQLRNNAQLNSIVEKIVAKHLPLLVSRNYQVIAKDLGVSIDEVVANVQTIAKLEPDPGRQFGGDTPQVIIPDVYVFKSGDKWIVSLNEDGIPRLRVNKSYREIIKEKGKGSEEKSYIDEKLKSAEWLIKSLQQRQQTIYRVTKCIVEKQKEFFEHGIEYLRPMILKDVSKELEMHESTISRVTNGKYVHTPQGILELKFFFNSAVSTGEGESVTNEMVKRKIAELVKREDVRYPLSDKAIVETLAKTDIKLARRTIAKYREQMNIPPSNKRKKYFA